MIVADTIIQVNHLTKTFKSNKNEDEVIALNDITFDLKRGDSLALIGPNGAGKSTLLKVLSQITKPSGGSVEVKGKVVSLLELGTGFHPELTGKENVYFYGGLNGYSKSFLTSIMNSIFEFSGVEEFQNFPVKNYSSGMYIRLAFATAYFLPFDILFLDEIMSVGDLQFRKMVVKSINDLRKRNDKTIISVSHNLTSLLNITDKAIWLNNGKIIDFGPSNAIINSYIQSAINKNVINNYSKISISKFGCKSLLNTSLSALSPAEIYFEMESDFLIENLSIKLVIRDEQDRVMTILNSELQDKYYSVRPNVITYVKCKLANLPFLSGNYSVDLTITHNQMEFYHAPCLYYFIIDNFSILSSEPLLKEGVLLIPKWDSSL
ncbi:MAG TPA: ABC transporter ATP-binding protein [Saprospiraceae bacterium]|nr:ABC transporter ATP-binding protein [Saprospiraceae bacterium]